MFSGSHQLVHKQLVAGKVVSKIAGEVNITGAVKIEDTTKVDGMGDVTLQVDASVKSTTRRSGTGKYEYKAFAGIDSTGVDSVRSAAAEGPHEFASTL